MIILGIAGGSGSGKSTVVKEIVDRLPIDSVSVLPQDAYYKDNSHLLSEEKTKINFDHPNSIEFDLLIEHLLKLKNNETVKMPTYNYITCSRNNETIAVNPNKIVIVEGILIFTNELLRNMFDIKVFVDADDDDRLIRIINRDIEERGRTFRQTFTHYQTFVKPMYMQFIVPSKKFADLIIPQGGMNVIAIDILLSKIKSYLNI